MWQNAEYWVNEWKKERENSLYEQRKQVIDKAEWWNQRAAGFAARTNDHDSHKNQEKVLAILREREFLGPDSEVLDIGCGPGNYSLKIASQVKHVVALDPSEKMLSILKERAESLNIKNIETVCMPWEEIDLDLLNWRNRFGLVMAIKTPGIKDEESLRKMIAASSRGCFYNGFIKREDHAQTEIWRLLYNEEIPAISANAFYIFHLLFAWGYIPEFYLQKKHKERRVAVHEAEREMMIRMKPYQDINGSMEEVIRCYFRQNSVEGKYNSVFDTVEGNIIWFV